jgi:hypothetical protein
MTKGVFRPFSYGRHIYIHPVPLRKREGLVLCGLLVEKINVVSRFNRKGVQKGMIVTS